MITRLYLYLYDGDSTAFDGHSLHDRGNVPIEHEPGEAVTMEMVRKAVEDTRLKDLPAGRYRLIPEQATWGPVVDVTVTSQVVLA